MLRQSLNLEKIRPLDKALWAGAVDNLGGDVLAWMASTMKQGGTIASIGLAASHTLNTTVMPFILRGAEPARYRFRLYRRALSQRYLAAPGVGHEAAASGSHGTQGGLRRIARSFPEYLAGVRVAGSWSTLAVSD